MDGIIIINKPQAMTSHDVVAFLRRRTGVKRIGHSGTLDPMATGVLPVFIGKATRLIEYSSRPGDPEAKTYRCTMKLGIETDTQDVWGEIISVNNDKRPSAEEIESALKGFEGPGVQRPPNFSAVKIDGRKMYELARKGVEVEEEKIKLREIYIKHIYVNHIDQERNEVTFDVCCSKGVYIRTLCADVGRILGCGAVMSGLIRLKSDGFSIENAISLDSLRDEKAPFPELLEPDAPLGWMPRCDLDVGPARKFCLGQTVDMPQRIYQPQEHIRTDAGSIQEDAGSIREDAGSARETQLVRVYSDDSFLGIGNVVESTGLKPQKVIASIA